MHKFSHTAIFFALASAFVCSTAAAQTAPDAGTLRQQIEQGRDATGEKRNGNSDGVFVYVMHGYDP